MSEHNEFSGGSRYDCIVVGAGHAGCEAALVAARAGLSVLVLTGSMDAIAWMPCNPAIGGPGKAQVVREVDALGGEMGLNAERSLTQIKLLNTSKGRAVQSVRTQCDKWQYSASMKQVLENQPNLTLKQERVERVLTQSGRVVGVVTNYRVRYEADTVVLTTGTYLGGVGRKTTGVSKRKFKPNIQKVRAVVDGRVMRIRVSAKAIRMGLVVKPPKRDWSPPAPELVAEA